MQYEKFCHLAALNSLNLLSDSERDLLEVYLIECPAVENQLTEFETTCASIAYSIPLTAMSMECQEKLWQKIVKNYQPINSSEVSVYGSIIKADEVEWKPSCLPGINLATLHQDLATGEITCLLKINREVEESFYLPTVEEIYIISGDLIINSQICRSGDYIHDLPNTHPFPKTTQGCLLLVRMRLEPNCLLFGDSEDN